MNLSITLAILSTANNYRLIWSAVSASRASRIKMVFAQWKIAKISIKNLPVISAIPVIQLQMESALLLTVKWPHRHLNAQDVSKDSFFKEQFVLRKETLTALILTPTATVLAVLVDFNSSANVVLPISWDVSNTVLMAASHAHQAT